MVEKWEKPLVGKNVLALSTLALFQSVLNLIATIGSNSPERVLYFGRADLHEIEYDSDVQATLTQNRYGCVILNARKLLIVDIVSA